MTILTILIIPIPEHGLYFHFWNHLRIPLLIFYSFQHIDLSLPLLSLFLGTFNMLFTVTFYISLQVYRRAQISLH